MKKAAEITMDPPAHRGRTVTRCYYRLARMYETGHNGGVDINLEKAKFWYEKALLGTPECADTVKEILEQEKFRNVMSKQ